MSHAHDIPADPGQIKIPIALKALALLAVLAGGGAFYWALSSGHAGK